MPKLKRASNAILFSLAFIIIGVLMCIFRRESIGIAFYIIGAIFIGLGIYNIIAKATVQGIIMLVVGILVCFGGLGDIVLMIMMIVFGVYLIVRGIVYLSNCKGNLIALILGILTIAIGCMFAFNYWWGGDIVAIIIGVTLIINGVLGLIPVKK